MGGRSGPFWDAVEGRASLPRSARGRVVHRDGEMAFLEATLVDSGEATTATATATARVIPLERAPAAV